MAQEIHLRDYLYVISKRRYTVYSIFLVIYSVLVIGTFSATPMYRATTKLLIEMVEPYRIIDYRYASNDPQFYSTQYDLIKSRPVAEKVVNSMLSERKTAIYLLNRYGGGSGWVEKLSTGEFELDEDSLAPIKYEIVQSILNDIYVVPVADTKMVKVTYISDDPTFAAIVANRWTESYIHALQDIRMSGSAMTLELISNQVKEERAKLERSEQEMATYLQNSDIVTVEDRLAVLPQMLAELSTQITRAEARRKELEHLNKKLSDLPEDLAGADAVPVVAADPVIGQIRSELIISRRKVAEMSRRYGERHPAMIEARNEYELLANALKSEIRRVVNSVKIEFDLALSKELDLKSMLANTKHEALEMNRKIIQFGVIKRDVETNRQIFDSLLKRMGEQSINEEIQSVKVVHIEKALPPDFPFKPRKGTNLFMGLFLALFGGCVGAFIVEYFDNTVKSPDELEEKVAVSVLGMVGFLNVKLKEEDVQMQIERVVIDSTRSTFAENFKALRTAIMLSSASAPPRSLLVTSMGPEEGKTSVSSNLAAVVTQLNKKVLLIDCDLRKPRIHKVFNVANDNGISSYLAGSDDLKIHKTDVEGLDLITSGPIPPNPSEILGSSRFDEFIKSAYEKYDMVICDSSPVLSVTDSLVLSNKLDGSVLVARFGKTTYESLIKGTRMLRDVNANILGVLINAVEARKGDYYYYKYYSYYSYGAPEDENK